MCVRERIGTVGRIREEHNSPLLRTCIRLFDLHDLIDCRMFDSLRNSARPVNLNIG
jgi:hypothetical protein